MTEITDWNEEHVEPEMADNAGQSQDQPQEQEPEKARPVTRRRQHRRQPAAPTVSLEDGIPWSLMDDALAFYMAYSAMSGHDQETYRRAFGFQNPQNPIPASTVIYGALTDRENDMARLRFCSDLVGDVWSGRNDLMVVVRHSQAFGLLSEDVKQGCVQFLNAILGDDLIQAADDPVLLFGNMIEALAEVGQDEGRVNEARRVLEVFQGLYRTEDEEN